MQNIWCWLRENWKLIIFSGLFASFMLKIIDAIIDIPKLLRVKKVIKAIQSKIDEDVQQFNSWLKEHQESYKEGFPLIIVPIHLMNELHETPEIVNKALMKLLRRKIIKRDIGTPNYIYKIVIKS
jgi:hypothetical protein